MKFEEARKHIGMKQMDFFKLWKASKFQELETVNISVDKMLKCGCIITFSSDRPTAERRTTCPNPQLDRCDFNVKYRTDVEHTVDEDGRNKYTQVKVLHQVNYQGNGKFIRKHYKKQMMADKRTMLAECAKYLDPVEIICLGDSDEL